MQMPLVQTFDRLLFGALTRGWPRERVDNYVEMLRVDNRESAVPGVVGRTFQTIDAKASGVLTHTSMMVAALGVSSRIVADNRFEQWIIMAEITCYLVVAVGCLRCMEVFNEHNDMHLVPDASAAAVRREVILRRQLFMMCNRAAIFLTALMLVTLIALFAYVPAPA